MAAVFASAAVGAASSTTADVVVALPPGTASGDLLLAFLACGSAPTAVWTPSGSGWTEVSDGTINTAAFWKIAGSSEPASYTFTRSTTGSTVGYGTLARVPGADPSTPVQAFGASTSGSGASSTPASSSALTAASANTLVVEVFAMAATSGTVTAPGTVTSTYDLTSSSGSTRRFFGGTKTVNSGAVSADTWTWSASAQWRGGTFLVNPASTATTGTLSATLPALTASLAGDVAPLGSMDSTLPALTSAMSGTVTVLADLASTLPALSAQFAGGPEGGPVAGDLTATLPALTADVAARADEDGPGCTPTLPDPTIPAADIPDPTRIIRTIAVSLPPVELVAGRPTQAWKDQAVTVQGTWGAYRLLIGGIDWTLHRGYQFQVPTRQHVDPFGHGALNLVLPGVTPFETDQWKRPGGGSGDLAGLSEWAQVVLQVVDESGADRTLWVGFIGSTDPQPDGLHLACAGHARGRLDAAIKLARPFATYQDAGTMLYDLARRPGLRITPAFGIETGVVLDYRSRAGGRLSETCDEVMALSQQSDGRTLTVMPTGTHGTTYQMQWRDDETVHYTVHYGAHGITPSLQSNIIDRPTTEYGVGRDDDGGLWANFKARLFLTDPPPFPGAFGPGDEGETVNLWQGLLIGIGGLLRRRDAVGGFNDATADATMDLQEEAGLPETGIVNEATWNAGWNVGISGVSLSNGHMEPLAELLSTKRFFTNANGIPYAANPDYDPLRPRVEELIDYGVMAKGKARRRARGRRYKLAHAQQWAGTLRVETDLFAGDHHHGDPDPVVVSRFEPLAGKNIMLRGWDGDVLLHVAGDDKDATGATLSVDSAGRPLLEVRQIIERNKEGRRNPAKTFLRQHKGVDIGGIGEWVSELGGEVTVDTHLQGNRWNVFSVVAGDEGTIGRLRMHLTSSECEYAVALFAKPIDEAWANGHLPNPFDTIGRLRNLRVADAGSGYSTPPTVSFTGGGGTGAAAVARVADGKVIGVDWTSRGKGYTSAPDVSLSSADGTGASIRVGIGSIGARAWQSEAVRNALDDRRILLGAWGEPEQPCGYYPGQKSDEDGGRSGDPVTGVFLDEAGFAYRTFADEDITNGRRGELFFAVFPKQDCVAKQQRVLWPAYEVGM